jgi:hypothetical protein
MSEKLKNHDNPFELEPNNNEVQHEQTETEPLKPESSEVKVENIEQAREKIEEAEVESAEVLNHSLESGLDSNDPILAPSDQAKNVKLSTNLSIIRSNLNKTSKTFSNLVHRPVINSLSEISAKTIVRPSAILCGGLFTLIGSGYYLYLEKQTGYKYNFFVAIILFAGGFIIGLIIEAIYKLLFARTTK